MLVMRLRSASKFSTLNTIPGRRPWFSFLSICNSWAMTESRISYDML